MSTIARHAFSNFVVRIRSKMKLTKLSFLVSLILCSAAAAFAQSGTIRGSIYDEETGEALIGATAQISGTSKGAVTDMDGKFNINNVDAGSYTIQLSYLGYQSREIANVAVQSNDVTVLDLRLKTAATALSEVVVTAEATRSNEIAMLALQRKSSLVLDGISARQFSMNGDNDAGAAIKRVTGVSVEGGKYVYVRGLGDRYSKTSLNKSEIPGLDPNRNTVQMDLFPANLIDNLTVYKTFSPEIPANFSGGYVNISTKEFPDQFTLQASGSIGFNTNATFKEGVLTDDFGPYHAYGIINKDRELPRRVEDGVTQVSFDNYGQARSVDREVKSFSSSMAPSTYSPSLNHNFSFSVGDQKSIFGKQVGFIGGLSYQRNYAAYDKGDMGVYFLPGDITAQSLDTSRYLSVNRGMESVLWGALFNTSVKLSTNHKLGLNLMHNQSVDASTLFSEGPYMFASGNDPDYYIQTHQMEYVGRSLTSGQLKGDHVLGRRRIRLDWLGSYTMSIQKEPDQKVFQNIRDGAASEYTYDAVTNNVVPPTRYFRDMDEYNIDAKVNLDIPVATGKNESRIKVGGSMVKKERNFFESIIQYKPGGNTVPFAGSVEDYFHESNLGLVGPSDEIQYGLFLQDLTTGGGTYFGTENIPAAYAMIDWQVNKRLKISTGARYEKTDISLENVNARPEERYASLNNDDILPALNVTKQLGDKSNLRFGYGRTIARPSFRELAKFSTWNFSQGIREVGNSELVRTTVDNIDFRYEVFPRSSELISFSAFYKNFINPIEKVIDPNSNDQDLIIRPRNVDQAWLAGLELEFRKSLSFLTSSLDNFSLGVNFAYIYSEVDIDPGELKLIRQNDPNAESTRVMFGQSPYIVNAILSYDDTERRINANVNFNVQGERLSAVSTGAIPNVFEQPRPVLDLNFKKGISENFSFKVSATNLLNSGFRFTQEFKGQEYSYSSYKLGQTFTIGLSYLIE
jgi:outer membrane receptor for ferrienterochelin and colicin